VSKMDSLEAEEIVGWCGSHPVTLGEVGGVRRCLDWETCLNWSSGYRRVMIEGAGPIVKTEVVTNNPRWARLVAVRKCQSESGAVSVDWSDFPVGP